MKTRQYVAPRTSAPDALAAKSAPAKKKAARAPVIKERLPGKTNAEWAFDI
jgi:hypothetical protein